MKIKYYLNFTEEKRQSMNMYGEELISHQKKNFRDLTISSYSPYLDNFSKVLFSKKWKMRYSRYISYPNQIKKLPQHDVAHICDHQYAHLYRYINSSLKFVTVHDLVPLVFQKKLKHNPKLLKYSLKHLKFFNKVFAISNNTKNDIIRYTDCPEEKIIVIYRAVDKKFNVDQIDKKQIAEKYKIPLNKKKILISGDIFYKNNDVSFKVLKKLIEVDENIILIHIGSVIKHRKLSKELEKNIIRLPFIERSEIPNIYKLVDILLFPSIYEGFGMPILEAMSCGKPVVCSNNSSIKEITGSTALMSNHNDVDFFVRNILKLFSDKEFYNEVSSQAAKRAKVFNINIFHDNLLKIYKDEMKKIIYI